MPETSATPVMEGGPSVADPRINPRENLSSDFDKEFALSSNINPEETPLAELTIETVETDLESNEEEDEGGEPEIEEKKEKEVEEEEDSDEDVALNDLSVTDRQKLLEELMDDDALTIPYRSNGKDVRASVAEIKRAAAGYAGQDAVTKASADFKKEMEDARGALKIRQDEIVQAFKTPRTFYDLIEKNMEDPVEFLNGFLPLAQDLLDTVERDPVGFKRDRAMNRQEQRLVELTAKLESLVGGETAPRRQAAEEPKVDYDKEATASANAEGQKRMDWVTEKHPDIDMDELIEAFGKAGRPDDFYQWFAGDFQKGRVVSKQVVDANKARRTKAGSKVRGRGGNSKGSSRANEHSKFPDIKEINAFLSKRGVGDLSS
jgi:hypothetical protein